MKTTFKNIVTAIACSFFCLSANFPAGEEAHDIHLSKCQLVASDDGTIDVNCHIWLDDLDLALQKAGYGELHLLTPNESDNADEILLTYLTSKLQLTVNGSPALLTWKGKEPSEDNLAVWVHLQLPEVIQLKTLRAQNSLLMELYDDQQNILHVKGPGGKQGYLIFEEAGQVEEVKF